MHLKEYWKDQCHLLEKEKFEPSIRKRIKTEEAKGKIYCKNCKHYNPLFQTCTTEQIYQDTPIEVKSYMAVVSERNKNNNCNLYNEIKVKIIPPGKNEKLIQFIENADCVLLTILAFIGITLIVIKLT